MDVFTFKISSIHKDIFYIKQIFFSGTLVFLNIFTLFQILNFNQCKLPIVIDAHYISLEWASSEYYDNSSFLFFQYANELKLNNMSEEEKFFFIIYKSFLFLSF